MMLKTTQCERTQIGRDGNYQKARDQHAREAVLAFTCDGYVPIGRCSPEYCRCQYMGHQQHFDSEPDLVGLRMLGAVISEEVVEAGADDEDEERPEDRPKTKLRAGSGR